MLLYTDLAIHVQLAFKFSYLPLLSQKNRHDHWLKDNRVAGVAACHSITSAHIHQLLECFLLTAAFQSVSEAFPVFNLKLQSHPVSWNSLTHQSNLPTERAYARG